MISKAPVEIVFVEMKPDTYEKKFWKKMGGKDEELAAQLAEIDAIETARKNGHAPWQLAQYINTVTLPPPGSRGLPGGKGE